ncbi:MAG TPA: DEAD/DEAH box helicase [Candidatus Hydrogenedentes bacterium]|nr:DEAD/DEAH box helicase [Candidatus Hydrogenedentota bacterium]
MKMNELIRYGVPPEIIQLWRERESEILLPLQEMAIKRHGLFGANGCGATTTAPHQNFLIQAPTSSGKTFIGEMAAIETALRQKKVVYLVPLKALAEEKFLDFDEKYTPYGLRVIISSRDHREFDRHLEDGDFSIAVVVYEKLSQLLVRRPERLHEIELVIADELELLSDPDRGAAVEILLTRLLQTSCRIIGLLAVVGCADKLAEWMKGELLFYERRPVELRYGVLHAGVFRYRTYNECSEGEESLIDAHSDSAWEQLTVNLCAFVERGEPCLVFVKAKHESRRGAELLAGRVNLPAAVHAIERLQRLEPTRSRDGLVETLQNGVAFHNADMSREERHIVEEAFRAGEVKAIVSTSTLAMGLNLPARNVFIASDKWRYDRRFGMPWKTPILRAEYESMGGRAGRYGAGHEFGRSILVATTPFEQETLWRRYVEGECEPIAPQIARGPLENHVLQLVASRSCRSETELRDFLEGSLTGQWVWRESLSIEEVEFRIQSAVNRTIDSGACAKTPDGWLETTPLGAAIAAKGITIATAQDLEHWIAESETRIWRPIDLLFAVAMTQDGRMVQFSLTSREYEHADYAGRLRRLTDGDDIGADVPLNRLRNCNLMPFFEEVRAIKVALLLDEWIEHAALAALEEQFHTMSGQIVAAAEQISWLADAAAAIALALGARKAFIEQIRTLSERAARGVSEDVLPLARAVPGLTRRALLGLAADGLHTPCAISQVDVRKLSRWMPKEDVRRLKNWARRSINDSEKEQANAHPPATVLVVDDKHPGQVLLDGAPIRLQEKQYRLIRALAERPGECVPYETIYQAVWEDTIVEPNQMHFQKQKLLAGIKKTCPNRASLIKTIPKRGFVLDLAAEEVELHPAPAVSAA